MSDRTRFAAGLMVVASGAATFAIVFRASLNLVYRLVYGADNVVSAISTLPRWTRVVVLITVAAIVGIVARLRAARAQGVSNVMEAIALGNVHLSLSTTISRVVASWTALAGGMSIGREGPLIEFGGSLGAVVGRLFATSLNHTRVLVAAGTAAGFAAAYNTPLAAIVFVVETIVGIAAPLVLLPAMAAAFIATALTRAVVGAGPIYGQRAFGLGSSVELLAFAALGIAAALAAAAFKQILALFERAFESQPIPQPFRAILGGAIVGGTAAWIPAVAGNGYEPLNAMLDAPMTVRAVTLLVVGKVVATSASVASGVPGGVFTPMLLVGAAVGTVWAHVIGLVASTQVNIGSYALVGMAAVTAGSIHAPLTATIMVFELSGDYLIVLPLILATVISTYISKAIGSESVYEAELRRRGLGWDLTLEGRLLKSGRAAAESDK
jgi:chloride channel protein, CIC family